MEVEHESEGNLSRTLKDFDPRLKREKTYAELANAIVADYEKQLDSSKEIVDERSRLGVMNAYGFLTDRIEKADITKAQKRKLLSVMKQADRDLEKANTFASYVMHNWQSHSWNWRAEKASEDLANHPSIADDLRERLGIER
jgi:hypothetical protein